MSNAWVEHVRQYAKDNNLTYACAIPYAKATYTKKDGTKSTPSKSLPAPKPEPKAKPKATPKPEPKATPKPEPKSTPKPAVSTQRYFQLAQEYINLADQKALNDLFANKSKEEKMKIGNDLIQKLNDIARSMDSEKKKIDDPIAFVKNMTDEEKKIQKAMDTASNAFTRRMRKALGQGMTFHRSYNK